MDATGSSSAAVSLIPKRSGITLCSPHLEPPCRRWCKPVAPGGISRCAASVHMEFLSETGEVESKTFRTTAYLEGKSTQGQQHADESGRASKGGTCTFCKFSVDGETGNVKPKFPCDECHIRHSLLTVATPKHHVFFDDMARLSLANCGQ